MGHKIIVIEDSFEDLKLIEYVLQEYKLQSFNCGEKALCYLKNNPPDLVILDLSLPDLDGIDVCRRIRKQESIEEYLPIIMVSARNWDEERGFNVGTTYFISKPFAPNQLRSRVISAFEILDKFRRKTQKKTIKIDDIYIFVSQQKVRKKNIDIPVTSLEFDILIYIVSNPDRVLSREEILESIWRTKYIENKNVDVHICNLKRKIGKPFSQRIKAVRNKGYIFSF